MYLNFIRFFYSVFQSRTLSYFFFSFSRFPLVHFFALSLTPTFHPRLSPLYIYFYLIDSLLIFQHRCPDPSLLSPQDGCLASHDFSFLTWLPTTNLSCLFPIFCIQAYCLYTSVHFNSSPAERHLLLYSCICNSVPCSSFVFVFVHFH